jgi:hypothetical protein
VVAISAEGKYLAAVNVGTGPRAVTIDGKGDIWAGGYNGARIVKISKQTRTAIHTIGDSRLCTYGAATDSYGNVWTLNRCKSTIAKIDISTGQIVGTYSAPGCYGIAADRRGYVWVASYENSAAYQYDAKNGSLVKTYALGARGRGIAIDANNRAWVACSHNNSSQNTRHVSRVDPFQVQVDIFTNVGLHTIGIAVDSAGYVWANSYQEGKAYKLRVSDGSQVAAYPVCDTTGTRPCANTGCVPCSNIASSGPYTYSDMTGFQIQTRPAKGTWTRAFDATCHAQFSKLSWTGTVPANTAIKARARTAASQAALANAVWGPYVANGNSPSVLPGRWIEVEFLLETSDIRITPAVISGDLSFSYFPEVCDGIDNNCNGQIDEDWPELGQPCTVGIGACQRSGKLVCDTGMKGTTCSVKPGAPSPEVCDGIDNDCNGLVDENFPDLGKPCTVGIGACQQSGKMVCDASKTKTTCSVQPGTPTKELCDGIDNNCNGLIDEDFPDLGQTCKVGIGACERSGKMICDTSKTKTVCSATPGTPTKELCDGIDNNCNGLVDEDFSDLSQPCKVGIGACERSGKMVCDTSKTKTVCSATPGQPSPELCDGIDNNCNGQVDEDFSDLGQPCKVGIGACERSGKMVCDPSKTKTVCSATPGQPSPELCDGIDNNCNGLIDEDFPDLGQPCKVGIGACERSGKMICDPSKTKTVCSATPGQPTREMCDGIDNNCNGLSDEDWPELGKPCDVGVGTCLNTGIWICRTDKTGSACSVHPKAPSPEICDGLDNDCNGLIDDGLLKGCETACGKGTMRCENGQWTACSAREPTSEVCNGIDDDCDGLVDNGLTRVCETICGKGMETCVNGQWVFCDAPKPTTEICDGLDNDCNGKIDDGIPPRKCLGDCGEGVAECINGKWSGCSGPAPEPEICDGKDNDCNGKIDDNLERKCRSACGEGREICIMGQWTLCNAPQPSQEICDGKDNDCNGKIDEGDALCPPAMICYEGACRQSCRSGECPSGMRCIHGVCVSEEDPCKNIKCADDTRCVGGRCVEICYFVSCPEGQVCEKGKCVENNCYHTGCDKGMRCVNGKCEADPCFGINCPDGKFCRNGQCVDSCADIKCAEGQRCINGQCETIPVDKCDSVKCPAGQRCISGECEADPCYGIVCPHGRNCIDGNCVHDPCVNIKCPVGQICQEDQCITDPNYKPEEPPPVIDEKKTVDGEVAADGGQGKEDQIYPDNDTSTKPDQSSILPTDDSKSIATNDNDQAVLDRGAGTPNVATDAEPMRYQPGACGCQAQTGTLPLLLWGLLLLSLLYFSRLRKRSS